MRQIRRGKKRFFAKKYINCSCGNVIDIKTDKMASKRCPHCRNQVVFDQTLGDDAVCPVCHNPINVYSGQQDLEEFSCRQCGIRLSAAKGAVRFVCPVCDCENDVQERLISERIRTDGLASIIKYEGDNSTFVWKHPIEDFNYGSQLIVHESQEALFFRDGQALDLFGPGRYTLQTQQLPLLDRVYNLPTDTQGTFHSEVYFINKTVQMAIKWGTPERVRFIDPLTGTPLQLGASGEMNIAVDNSRKLLLKLVGTTKGISWEDGEGLTKSLQASFRPLITSAVKANLPTVIRDEAIDILEIDSKLELISGKLCEAIRPGFEDYGLTIPQFFVTNVVLPEEDPNFKRIRELHTITLQTRAYQAEATIKTAQAQSETMYRTAQEQSKAAIEAARREAELQKQTTETEIARMAAERRIIAAQAEAQAQRMAGLTEAEIMAAKGYSQKDVLQAEVQKSYAEAIGNMGPDTVNGSSGSGLAGDVLGLGMGIAAAGAVAPQIGGMLRGFGVGNQTQPATPDAWDCACGQKGVVGNFCSNCGARRPSFAANTWDCACGQKGNTGSFCSNCGAKKPASAAATWDCACGQKAISGNFCPNCGNKKGE